MLASCLGIRAERAHPVMGNFLPSSVLTMVSVVLKTNLYYNILQLLMLYLNDRQSRPLVGRVVAS